MSTTPHVASKLLLSDVTVGDEVPALDVDVSTTTIVLGALASRDWRPMHHDRTFAQERNGTRDIFMNAPHQATYFERYLTDWSGPHGRLGRMKFRILASVFPGDTMTFRGVVDGVSTDDAGCGWVDLTVTLTVGDTTVSECSARIALPVDATDNPWDRHNEDWKP